VRSKGKSYPLGGVNHYFGGVVKIGVDQNTSSSRLVVCDPLMTFQLFCDQQNCFNWMAPMSQKFNFQFGGCFLLPDLTLSNWLTEEIGPEIGPEKVKFWNPIIQTGNPS